MFQFHAIYWNIYNSFLSFQLHQHRQEKVYHYYIFTYVSRQNLCCLMISNLNLYHRRKNWYEEIEDKWKKFKKLPSTWGAHDDIRRGSYKSFIKQNRDGTSMRGWSRERHTKKYRIEGIKMNLVTRKHLWHPHTTRRWKNCRLHDNVVLLLERNWFKIYYSYINCATVQ